jgi:hypothetical protein
MIPFAHILRILPSGTVVYYFHAGRLALCYSDYDLPWEEATDFSELF